MGQFQDTTDPDAYHLVEVFRDEQGVATHRETAHYARWAKASREFLAKRLTLVQVRGVLPLTLPSQPARSDPPSPPAALERGSRDPP
ncbi:antibiotic biosynthesis monooxygenase [Streptomyces sp. NPDC052107]|uniref:putative quinol monooxygenase n=1 Tax=Streptomyces sp. NPDC052107 TaxID=3155632 RepID=UPI003439AE77